MNKKNKTSFRFAIITSLLLTLTLTLILSVFLFSHDSIDLKGTILWVVLCFTCSFVILQLRLEKFIFKRLKRIYDDLTNLDSTPFAQQQILMDMDDLTAEIDNYAKTKKLEIETLKVREAYRKDFIGNIAHELKTPLFTVQGYISTLLDGAADNPEIRTKYLTRADKGVDRLIYIVKDLDMITKLEVGDVNLEMQNFDIIELIKNVFDLLEIKAQKKEISLALDKAYLNPILVHADQQRIQQVLTNLIVNSIKYGHKNGTTEVSVDTEHDQKVTINIADNGEGIHQSHLPRIFERFYRVDKSGSRKVGGSGLGLSIVKHIIEAHDEKIYVVSKFGIGSEFSFTLQKAQN